MSNVDKQALREAAEKYRTTYAAHLKNPRNYDALDAWDKATSEFMALVNNDELNIIASLIDEIDMETGCREGAFVACNRWHTKFRETEAKLEAAEKRIAELREWNAGLAQESCLQQQRIAELERDETKLIEERDNAEEALADMYQAATGERPEWSNFFGFTDAVDAVEERLASLESAQMQPVMFIDGDISSSDADKLAAVIREFNEETETPAARMARIIRENPHPTNMCDMPAADTGKGE